ncbi:MAG: FHA domain-containing protein [Planctomycetota bacterium]|nr:FHA domain-containing protein [Planctomycetota bacterium]
MDYQYALRFETGERRGEVVPILVDAAAGGVFSVGRRPGNSLQVIDGSVSGRHAEIHVSPSGVQVRDLGSTNGTLVDGRKVPEAGLQHLAVFSLGAVEFTLLDQRQAAPATDGIGGDELMLEEPEELVLEEPAAAPMPTRRAAPSPVPAAAPAPVRPPAPVSAPALDELDLPEGDDDSLVFTADDLARSRRSSKLGPLLVVVLAAGGAGAWWWTGQKSDAGAGRSGASAAVAAVPGNLIRTGYSFEKSEGWTVDETRAALWDPSRSARRSGRNGIRAELFGGDAATIASDPVRLNASSRSVQAIAQVRGESDASARLGLRFTGAGEGSPTMTVWSEPLAGGEEWGELSLQGTAPRGFDRVSVIVRGEGGGEPRPEDEDSAAEPASLDVDDVAIVPAEAAALRLREHDEWSMAVAGLDASGGVIAVSLSALDQPMVSSLQVLSPGAALDSVPFTIGGVDGAWELSPTGAGELVLRVEGGLVSAGLATLGGAGYVDHGTSFELWEARDLLLGADASLVRLSCTAPVRFSSKPAGDDVVLRASLPPGVTIKVQVEFSDERIQAERMARQAVELRKRGSRGAALAMWRTLLSTVPFDAGLVDRAIVAQSELGGEARASLKELEGELERARFFGLPGLFQEKLEHARSLAKEYEGAGEAEAQFQELAAGIATELEGMLGESDRYERLRLEAISTVLKNDGALDLVKRLDDYAAGLGSGEGEER